MALDACIAVTGGKQGAFKGGSPIKSRAGTSIVVESNIKVASPRDLHSGASTGKRQWEPVRLELLHDPAYINFMSALVTNEQLTKVLISYFQTASAAGQTAGQTATLGGEAAAHFTVELATAQVSSVNFDQPYSRSVEDETKHRDLHYTVELTFTKITLTWVKGGVTVQDDWTMAV